MKVRLRSKPVAGENANGFLTSPISHRRLLKGLLGLGAVGVAAAAPKAADATYYSGTPDRFDANLVVDGSLGVGTSAPASRLHVKGSSPAATIEATSGTPEIDFVRAGTVQWTLRNIDADNSFRLALGTTASEAPFDPTTVPGLQAWYKADALALADGASITTWPDLSGNGRNLGSGSGITYKANFLNGKPVASFAGAGAIAASGFALNQPMTVFLVVKSSTTTNGTVMDGQAAVNTLRVFNVSANIWQLHAGGSWNPGTTTVTDWMVLGGLFNGASSAMWWSGVPATTPTGTAGTNNASGIRLGNAGNGTDNFNGYVAEVLVYSGNVTASQRQQVENYLLQKYGLGGSAPSATSVDRLIVQADGTIRLNATSLVLGAQSGGGSVVFVTGTAPLERMRISAGGNVGIGTTSPSEVLHLYRSQASLVGLKIENGTSAPYAYAGITFLTSTPRSAEIKMSSEAAEGAGDLIFNAAFQRGFRFQSAGYPIARIDSLGRVGIGTLNPSRILDVVGDASVSGAVAVSGRIDAGRVRIGSDASTSNWLSIAHGPNPGPNSGIWFGPENQSIWTLHGYGGDNKLHVATAGEDRMIFDGVGNIGVATATPVRKFEVNGDAEVRGRLWVNGSEVVASGGGGGSTINAYYAP